MIPEHLKFGGGVAGTLLHPAVLVAVLIAVPAILLLRRKYVVLPVLLLSFLTPLGQQIVVGGLHMLVLRIVIAIGLARMIASKRSRWDSLDRLFLLWAVVRMVTFLLFFSEMAALVNQFGFFWDAVGGFFLLRFLIQDDLDVRHAIQVLALIALIVAVCMLNERFRSENVFGYLGGISVVPTVREGSIRAQGPFAHPLLAGTFGATLVPLFAWLWTVGGSRLVATAGLAASTIITVMSASSTPVLAYIAAIIGICLWPLRNHLSIIRWGLVLGLVFLALIMKAPVWFVLARIDLTGGSSGYHRAMLIDQFIKHFGDWWLIGTNTNGSWGWDLWDTCNQYVTEGETGGLATLVCFVAIISVAFRRLGNARRAEYGSPDREWYFWALGTALFAHVVAFWGIMYFDQTRMLWYAMLAIIIAATYPAVARETVTEGQTTALPSASPGWTDASMPLCELTDEYLRAGVSNLTR